MEVFSMYFDELNVIFNALLVCVTGEKIKKHHPNAYLLS